METTTKNINLYTALKSKHEKEVNNFPMFFAFSNDNFNKGMKKLNLDPADTDKIYSIGGGGYIKKTDSETLHNMGKKHSKEMAEAIASDKTGDGFIYDMFLYELNNHEYCITYDLDDTLNALGLTIEQINNNEALLHGLKKARVIASQYD